MSGLARRSRLRSLWSKIGALALAGLIAFVMIRAGSPWWLLLTGGLVVWWLVTSVAAMVGSVFAGRLIGLLVAAAIGVVAAWPQSWSWRGVAAGLFLVAALLVWYRWSGGRKVDAARIDRVAVPLLDDDGNRLVDAIDSIWGRTGAGGERRGMRAVHTTGTMAQGEFRSTRPANARTGVQMFARGTHGTALVRCSNFPGFPERDDTKRVPHGLAMHLRHDDTSIDLVLVDIARFPVATREDFVSFTRQYRKRSVARLLGFAALVAAGRSSVLSILGLRQQAWPSYADRTYHGLNTFHWPRADGGGTVPVRYLAEPASDARPGAGEGPEALDRELRRRVSRGPVSFNVSLVLGIDGQGDPLPSSMLDDAMHRWPRSCPREPLCNVTLDEIVDDNEDVADWGFDPFNLPPGVRPSDDEILHARRAAYAVSQVRRGTAIGARA